MSPSFSTSRASTPVSSRTSRSAASAADSRPSGWPLGSASTRLPSAARRVGTITTQRPSRTTTPPAENSESRPLGIGVRRCSAGAPRRLAGGAGELGDPGLRDLELDVARSGALGLGLLDELDQHPRDAALDG